MNSGADGGWFLTAPEQSLHRRRKWARQRRRLGQQTSSVPAASTGRYLGAQLQTASSPGGAVDGHDQGMVLLAVLLCTLLRGSKLQESKVS